MEFDQLIRDGWQRHDTETASVADMLEQNLTLADDASKAAQLIALSNHTIGSHGGDWQRAAEVASRVAASLPETQELAAPLGSLAVAEFMAGNVARALAHECESARLSEGDALSALLRTRVLVASALVDGERLDEGALVYRAAVALARSRDEKLACDRAIAVTSNNLANALLGKPERSEAETTLMLEAAEAAREFWLKCGTWENEERAEYLLALVQNAVGEPETALEHAARGLEVIRRNGEEVVDEAFLNLAVADAWRRLENREKHEKALSQADELAEEWQDASLKEWYIGERTKVLWSPHA
jgi:tetratricopeptide (TPR) repeat protein